MSTPLVAILRRNSELSALKIEKAEKAKVDQEGMDKFERECQEMDAFISRLPTKLKSISNSSSRECRVMSITGKDTRVIDRLKTWAKSEGLNCVVRSEEEDPGRTQSSMIDALWITW